MIPTKSKKPRSRVPVVEIAAELISSVVAITRRRTIRRKAEMFAPGTLKDHSFQQIHGLADYNKFLFGVRESCGDRAIIEEGIVKEHEHSTRV